MDKNTLKILAKEYPNINKAAAEIINLNAILTLPKGTEYFFSDLHGEHEAFLHLLKSASGNIRDKIDQQFGNSLQEKERAELAEVIGYPKEIIKEFAKSDAEIYKEWFRVTVYRLIEIIKVVSEKYTRSKVKKRAPEEFAYIIDELLHVEYDNKALYYSSIVDAIFETGMEEDFLIGICQMIREIAVDSIHIIGDIYDRGAHADLIMDELMKYKEVDIQWGNHDICWIGAAVGNLTCIANVVCSSIRYNSFDFLEDGYNINLRALTTFASEVYAQDDCLIFEPKCYDQNKYDPVDRTLAAKMHKAMVIILFKLEGQLYKKHPEYNLSDRIMLEKIDYEKGTIEIDGELYDLEDKKFPTILPSEPLALTEKEEELMEILAASFRHSEKLQKHIKYMYAKGGMYKCVNNNLLYHGCIPFTEDGEFEKCIIDNKEYSGKAYFDKLNEIVKKAMFSSHHYDVECMERDFIWYLWCGEKSPLFGKNRMTLFEQYFVKDDKVATEIRNPYYDLIEQEHICNKILLEFGLDVQKAHILNGHVPVRIGENPIKANGKLFIIDGGISKAYHAKTGIGGYTLISTSNHLLLVEHKPFEKSSVYEAAKVDIVERRAKRMLVGDTDKGKELREYIEMLEELLVEYRTGSLKELE